VVLTINGVIIPVLKIKVFFGDKFNLKEPIMKV